MDIPTLSRSAKYRATWWASIVLIVGGVFLMENREALGLLALPTILLTILLELALSSVRSNDVILERVHSLPGRVIHSLEEAHNLYAELLGRNATSTTIREVFSINFHGVDKSKKLESNPELADTPVRYFDFALSKAIGNPCIRYRELINVVSVERLRNLRSRFGWWEKPENSQIRIITEPLSVPILELRAVGPRDVLIGRGHNAFNRMAEVIHLEGEEYFSFAQQLFESAWGSTKAVEVLSGAGFLNEGAFKELTVRIKAIERDNIARA